MRVLSWNVRGLGKKARKRQVRDYIIKERIEIVGLQETMKQDFSDHDLHELAGGINFSWLWLPAKGKSGSILLGVNIDHLEVEDHEIRFFSIRATIRDRRSNFRWNFVTVYGPAHHDSSPIFLDKLDSLCSNSTLPILLGGDFNLIRSCDEKNFEHYNIPLMRNFNSFIGAHQLREVSRRGAKSTWTNKQLSPTMVTLDRFLMSDSWDNRFPLTFAWSPVRIGSDHSPIILDTGEQGAPRPRYFYFDNRWLLSPDFIPKVRDKWEQSYDRRPPQITSLDAWHGSPCFLR